jgi:hypothetical protein
MFLLRKFTFWLSLLSVLICFCDYLGSRIANIILSQFTPGLYSMIRTDPFRRWLVDTEHIQPWVSDIFVPFRFSTYVTHLGLFLIVALLLDYLIHLFKRKKKMKIS